MAKPRGVCIGEGYFSHFQYEAWQRIPEVEIVAFSNHDPVKAAEVTRKFGLARVHPDYREMFELRTAGLRGCHHPAAVARGDLPRPEAARRGIQIICPKPLGAVAGHRAGDRGECRRDERAFHGA